MFKKCEGYSDSSKYLKTDELKWYVPGNTCSIGSYKGKSVDWTILTADGDKVLVATTYYIDYLRLDPGSADYEDSEIYAWMNGSFVQEAFTDEERNMISPSEFGKVFLLSHEEKERYYAGQGITWIGEGTAYAKALQAEKGNYAAAKWGWLRYSNYGEFATGTGDRELKYFERYIRVAMWIVPNK